MTYSEFMGNEDIVAMTKNAIERGKLPQFIMFVGEPGVGKSTLAHLVAKSILCETKDEFGNPCDNCKWCKAVDEENGAFQKINVPNILSKSEMKETSDTIFKFKPMYDKQVYLLEELDDMPSAHQKQLLEVLTHIPKGVTILACKVKKYDMLPAFRSRPLILELKKPNPQQSEKLIRQLCGKLGIHFSSNQIVKKFAELCEFNPRLMRNNLEFVATNNNLTIESLQKRFKIISPEESLRFLKILLESDNFSQMVKLSKELSDKGIIRETINSVLSEVYEYICCPNRKDHRFYEDLKSYKDSDLFYVYTAIVNHSKAKDDQQLLANLLNIKKDIVRDTNVTPIAESIAQPKKESKGCKCSESLEIDENPDDLYAEFTDEFSDITSTVGIQKITEVGK